MLIFDSCLTFEIPRKSNSGALTGHKRPGTGQPPENAFWNHLFKWSLFIGWFLRPASRRPLQARSLPVRSGMESQAIPPFRLCITPHSGDASLPVNTPASPTLLLYGAMPKPISSVCAVLAASLVLAACNSGTPEPRRYREIALKSKDGRGQSDVPIQLSWTLPEGWVDQPEGDPLRVA